MAFSFNAYGEMMMSFNLGKLLIVIRIKLAFAKLRL